LFECEPYVQYAVRKNILKQNKNQLSDLSRFIDVDEKALSRVEKYAKAISILKE